MRETKFRAWDNLDRKMSKAIPLIELIGEMPERLFGNHPWSHLIWMQYTGLHDKNGKEYYAEDIFLRQGIKHIIRWSEEGAGWWLYWLDGGASMPFKKVLAESGEVIGDIYSNPELLGK